MDPTACAREMVAAHDAGDMEAAMEYAENLSTWLGRGGFAPQGVVGWKEILKHLRGLR